MVAHNGDDYLPRTLAALADQTRPVDAFIGVDTGSRDDSPTLLEQAFGRANVTYFRDTKTGMGGAVRAALAALAPWKGDAVGTAEEWIWLLHDDAAPAPEALAELLNAVERAPSVTVAGCKQLDWHAPRRLIDVGLSTSRWAERLTLIDADELDQGQYDTRSDTFAVNSAGMLVRRDVWEQLHGFDPALPGTGYDVDFCWRNRLAGHRVVVVPSARMFHVGHRPGGLGTAAAARTAQVHLRLKHAPLWKVPFHAVGALLGSIFKLLLSIVVKDPRHGFSQLRATLTALGRPGALARARQMATKTRTVRRSVISGLQTPRREVWNHRRSLMEALGADNSPGDYSVSDPLADQPTGDSTDDFSALTSHERGWVGNGALLAVIVAAAASMIGLFGIFRADAVTGGALLPVSTSLADIWHQASSWWISLGAGLPGHGDPFGYVLWVLGLAGGGDANKAMAWLLLLAMPLSGLGAWFAAGALTSRRRFRLVAAVVWAGAPALQIALNQGRVGALLAHVMMPLLALALLRATGTAIGHGRFALLAPGDRRFTGKPPVKPGINGTPSWTAAAAGGLVLAVITASAPSLLLPAAVVIVLTSFLLGSRGRTIWWALLPSAALFIPFGLSVLDRPRALLADPGLPLGFDAAPLWQQMLGQPLLFDVDGGLTGLPPFLGVSVPWALLLALLIGVPVLLLAVAALFVPSTRTRVSRALWVCALIMLAGGWFAGQLATGANANTLVSPFAGPTVSAAVFALLGAAMIGAESMLGLASRASAANPGRTVLIRSFAVIGLVLLVVGPLAGLTAWTVQSRLNPAAGTLAPADGPRDLGTPRLIQAAASRILPATAIDRSGAPEQTRTLLISAGENGTFDAALMRGAGTTLDGLSTIASARSIFGHPGEETMREDDDVTVALRTIVATVVAATGVDPRVELERLGVGFIVLQASDSAAQLTANRMDAVPGLVAVGRTEAGWLWRISPLNEPAIEPGGVAHRVRVVDAGGTTIAQLPSGVENVDTAIEGGPEGRQVVLAERADSGWSAWLDGQKLTPTTSDWAQAFELPVQSGQLSIRYENPWALLAVIGQLVVLGLTLLLAIPVPASRPNSSLSRDEGSLRKVYQNA